MKTITLITAIVFMALLGSCKKKSDKKEEVSVPTFPVVSIETGFGNMYIRLYDSTMLHRANFIKLVEEGFYTGTEFHRIAADFVIQGGDPNSKDNDRTNDGKGGPGYTIPAEIDASKYTHVYGAVGAARLPDSVNPAKESSGSQFYIVVKAAGTHGLDGNYTVFGQVIGGMNNALTIMSQPHNSQDLPDNRIPMTVKMIAKTDAELLSEFGFTRPSDK
jgi:cyclophilin family peptidyl-prolyl cis-trans isomerase